MEVSADVVLDDGALLTAIYDLAFFRAQNSDLWLLQQTYRGHHIALTRRGPRLHSVAPYDELTEFRAGVSRAADEFAKLCRAGR